MLRTLLVVALALSALPSSALAAPEVIRFWLVDAAEDRRLFTLESGDVLDVSLLPEQLTIEAQTTLDTQSVELRLDGEVSSIENLEPYSLDGDDAGDYIPVARLRELGVVDVQATPFGADGLSGERGASARLMVTLRQPDFVVTDARDLHDAAPGDGRCESEVATCGLRAAIEEANALPGEQRVAINGKAGPYALALGELTVSEGVVLKGYYTTTIDAQRRGRLLTVNAGPTQLFDLILRNAVGGEQRGGAINLVGASLLLAGCVLSDNQANIGGGIYAESAELTLEDTVVRNNVAENLAGFSGGGITQRGGGLGIVGGTARLSRSAVYDNRAVRGGGISNNDASLTLESSSVFDNVALTRGGGIENFGTLTLSFVTVTGNQAGSSPLDGDAQRVGGGLYNGGTVRMASTILASNRDPWRAGDALVSPDCWGAGGFIISAGYNVVGVLTRDCRMGTVTLPGRLTEARGNIEHPLDPRLSRQSAADDAYYSPARDSPAIDRGPSACMSTDMKGRRRPRGAACDSGAIEAH
jgi:hypothetical protein